MATEMGQLLELKYIQEVAIGTTPATPAGQILRWTGLTLGADRSYIDNPELRTDMMMPVGRGGALRGKGEITGKLSYGTYDDFIGAALGNTAWVSNVAKVRPIVATGGASVTVAAAGKTFTRAAGDFTADGFRVGDTVIWSGFTNAGNNGSFIISAVSALVITCSTASGLVNEGPVTVNATANIRPSFTMEKAHKQNGIYFPFTGVVVDTMELSGKVNEAVEAKFSLVALSTGNEATSSVFTSSTAAGTNPLITTWEGTIKRGGVTLANVVGWTLKATRNLDSAEVVGSANLYDIQPKTARITGTMELYFDSVALYNDFRAENDVVFQLNLGPGGTKSYQIDLTKCRITKHGAEPKDGLMTQTVEFESFAPTSGTNTSCMITRLP